jgi:hypothetical protein
MNNPTGDLDQALAALQLPAAAGACWRASWSASQPSFDPNRIFFLTREFVDETGRTIGLKPELGVALGAALAFFEQQPALKRLAWHCHHLLFQDPEGYLQMAQWPQIPREAGEPAALFYALVALAGVPNLIELHRQRGIPRAITLATLSDLEIWIKEYNSPHTRFGPGQLGWLFHHLSGRLYRLGRLQFNFEFWKYDFLAFRHRRTKRVMLLAGANQQFRTDGQYADADGAKDTVAWTSVLHEPRPAVIRGNPVVPTGRVLREIIELPLTEWELIFRQGDPALGVHIPATGPMDHAECGEAFRQAGLFFPKYFPERPWKAFTCNSWLLDPQFERYLPAGSNVLRFLKEWYLFPVPKATAEQHYERIFGWQFTKLTPDQIAAAPQTTSLQKILVQHVQAGGRWRMSGSVLFPEDLAWGTAAYRNQTAPELPIAAD